MSCSNNPGRGRGAGRGLLAVLGCALAIAAASPGCASKEPEPKRAPLTERERDSTLGASGLPGGAAVTRALAVSDTAAARAARALPDHY